MTPDMTVTVDDRPESDKLETPPEPDFGWLVAAPGFDFGWLVAAPGFGGRRVCQCRACSTGVERDEVPEEET